MNPIESRANEKFKIWQSLTASKGIKKEALFLLSGEKLVREYLSLPSFELSAEIVPKGFERLTSDRKKVFELPKELFGEIDELGTHFNILVLRMPEIPQWNPEAKSESGLEIFCPLGDPANVGALLRNAEAFGATSVVLTTESANPFLPKAVKASAGSLLRVALKKGPPVSELPDGLTVLDDSGTSLNDYSWPKYTRLLVGEEGVGVANYKRGTPVRIPTLGVESLNATVAVGIALYSRFLQSKAGN